MRGQPLSPQHGLGQIGQANAMEEKEEEEDSGDEGIPRLDPRMVEDEANRELWAELDEGMEQGMTQEGRRPHFYPVSYTHLTLPTIE